MKKKTVGTPKRDRARRGALSKRGTLRSSGLTTVNEPPKISARFVRSQLGLEHSSYGMDDAWSCDILEKLEYIEKVFHFLKVDPAYYKSHLYYLKASVYELLELKETHDPH